MKFILTAIAFLVMTSVSCAGEQARPHEGYDGK
jgi:hypothetical protein